MIYWKSYFYMKNIHIIIKDDNNRLSELVLIEAIGIHSDLSLCDYILCPNERLSELESLFKITK